MASNTTGVARVWDDLFLLSAIFKVLNSRVEFSSLDGFGNIVSVLVMNAKVSNLALSGYINDAKILISE